MRNYNKRRKKFDVERKKPRYSLLSNLLKFYINKAQNETSNPIVSPSTIYRMMGEDFREGVLKFVRDNEFKEIHDYE